MSSLPCIAVLRPLADDSPALIKTETGFLYPAILKELVRQGVFSEILLSVAPDTPSRYVELVRSWGLPCEVGPKVQPNARVAHCALARGWELVACISAYTFFFDAEDIRRKAQAVESGEYDFAGAENALSNMEFTVLNDRALRYIQSLDRSLVPSKPQAISRKCPEGLRGHCVQDGYSPTEEFLWLMQYLGEIGEMPGDFITGFYSKYGPDQWFSREVREQYTVDHFGVSDIRWMDEVLVRDFFPHIPQLRLVGQLRWLERCLPEFPESGDRFLEMGYGDLPLIAYYLLSRFKSAIAIEPEFDEPPTCPDLKDLFAVVKTAAPHLDGVLPDMEENRLTVSNSLVEDLKLEDGSIDFCSSKMVFEHVQDVESTSRELFRILSPGGGMLHEIGLNDHTGGTSSGIHFDFLRHSQQEWTERWRGTNLLRLSDFVNLWEEMGFEVQVVSKVVSSNVPEIIHRSWFSRPLEDLLCQTAIVKATKPVR